MTERRESIESRIVEFFNTAPIDAAAALFEIVRSIVKKRLAAEKKKPPIAITDLRSAK